MQELLCQKVAGGYSVVECEGEVGNSVMSGCDDFTVETALEDLEFGFSVITSTQKVSHNMCSFLQVTYYEADSHACV